MSAQSEPALADVAPTSPEVTAYDRAQAVTYLRLLDAAAENADWREVTRVVLHIDCAKEPERAHRAWASHLARAKWLTQSGYRDLLHSGAAR